MTNKTQLFIRINDRWVELDLSDNVSFPVIFNIADVRDISKRNSSYSKTIILPHTSNNSNVLDFIFDVANVSTFNANKKVRCYVLNDTVQVFQGNFQLRNINTNNNRKFEYECVIFGENDTLFKNIGDGFLSDIDFSELNHEYTSNNIVDSWTKEWNSGYYYPLIDYNNNWDLTTIQTINKPSSIDVDDFKPAIYAKYIFDKIVREAGFIYDSNFLNSDNFNSLIIPFTGTELKQDAEWINQNRLYVGVTASYPLYGSTSSGTTFSVLFNGSSIMTATSSRKIEFNDESAPFGDPSNKWNVNSYEYTGDTVPLHQRFFIDLNMKVYNNFQGLTASSSISGGGDIFFRVVRNVNPITGVSEPLGYPVELDGYNYMVGTSSSIVNEGVLLGATFSKLYNLLNPSGDIPFKPVSVPNPSNKYVIEPIFNSFNLINTVAGPGGYNQYKVQLPTVELDGSTPDRKPLLVGEKLWVEVFATYAYDVIKDKIIPFAPSQYPFEIISDKVTLVGGEYPNTTSISTQISPSFVIGQEIDMNSILPQKIKKKDFITSIIKMFNLYVDVDRYNPDKLIIEPRNDFYLLGTVFDWSNKLDISKEIKQDIIAEVQNKKLLFTHKSDKDVYNTEYTDSWNEIFGQLEYDVDNDFTTGVNKIETIFSPTILEAVNGSTGIIIPKLFNSDTNTVKGTFKGNIRILQRGTQSVQLTNGEFWRFGTSTPLTEYPYAGHYNHPTRGTTDINFGIVNELYYNGNLITNNNLFNVYHRKQITELTDKDSRIVTAYFFLTPQDLNDFRLYDQIYVEQLSSGTGNYFKVNKIDYDPMFKGSYKVELIKSNDIELTIVRDESNTRIISVGSGGRNIQTGRVVIGSENDIRSTNNIFVVGDSNYVSHSTDGILISGSNNTIGGSVTSSTIIGGSNNSLYSSYNSSISGGNNNKVISASNSSSMGGYDNTISGFNNISIGGSNNRVTGSSSNSIIIGGSNNTINGDLKNSYILGGEGITATQSDKFVVIPSVEFDGTFSSSGKFTLNDTAPLYDNYHLVEVDSNDSVSGSTIHLETGYSLQPNGPASIDIIADPAINGDPQVYIKAPIVEISQPGVDGQLTMSFSNINIVSPLLFANNISIPEPIGTVKMFFPISGTFGTYFDPSTGLGRSNNAWRGYAVCDGRNGTPDLRSRVPFGYTNTGNTSLVGNPNGNNTTFNSVGATGGNTKIGIDRIPPHRHTGVASILDDDAATDDDLFSDAKTLSGVTTMAFAAKRGSTINSSGVALRQSTFSFNSGDGTNNISSQGSLSSTPADFYSPYNTLIYVIRIV